MVYGLSKDLYCHDEYLIVIFFHFCHLKIYQNTNKLKLRLALSSILPSWITSSVSKRTERFCASERFKPIERQHLRSHWKILLGLKRRDSMKGRNLIALRSYLHWFYICNFKLSLQNIFFGFTLSDKKKTFPVSTAYGDKITYMYLNFDITRLTETFLFTMPSRRFPSSFVM